jgi:hypothetical protein
MHVSKALDGEPNPHAHIMFSERRLDGVERSDAQFFKRAHPKDPERGGTPKDRQWQARDKPLELRESWANAVNRVPGAWRSASWTRGTRSPCGRRRLSGGGAGGEKGLYFSYEILNTVWTNPSPMRVSFLTDSVRECRG